MSENGTPDLDSFPLVAKGHKYEDFTVDQRMTHHWGRTLTQADNVAFFEQAEVTIGPIYDIEQILEDPHVLERELVADYPDADMGAFPMHHVVPRLMGTPGTIRR